MAKLDVRVSLLWVMGLSLSVWLTQAWGLGVIGILVGLGYWKVQLPYSKIISSLSFIMLWGLISLAGQWWFQSDLWLALKQTWLLVIRLGLSLSLGLFLIQLYSARQLALGLTWYLRPILGKYAWEVGLALALLVYFLPQMLRTTKIKLNCIKMRLAKTSWWYRQKVLVLACLNEIGQTRTISLALQTRHLISASAWTLPQGLGWQEIGYLLLEAVVLGFIFWLEF